MNFRKFVFSSMASILFIDKFSWVCTVIFTYFTVLDKELKKLLKKYIVLGFTYGLHLNEDYLFVLLLSTKVASELSIALKPGRVIYTVLQVSLEMMEKNFFERYGLLLGSYR